MIRKYGVLGMILVACLPVHAAEPMQPKTNSYVVQPGDSLWGISNKLLGDPTHWQSIWKANQDIDDPNLIYPGDRVTINKMAGRTVLSIHRGNKQLRAITLAQAKPVFSGRHKLSPKIREVKRSDDELGVSTAPIKTLLKRATVASPEQLVTAPYVVAMSGHRVLAGVNDEIYIRNYDLSQGKRFKVVRKVDPITDKDSGKVLGFAAKVKGIAVLEQDGDPATFRIDEVFQEVELGDKLIPDTSELKERLFIRKAVQREASQIVYVFGGVNNIGKDNLVVIDGGQDQQRGPGEVYTVYRTGEKVKDHRDENLDGKAISLPDTAAGEILVIESYDKLSLGLVTKAKSYMRTHDVIRPREFN